MHFFIRADASHEMGIGHVMRTLSLAHALTKLGHHITYLCLALEGNLIEHIASKNHTVITLEDDLKDTCRHVSKAREAVVIIDHYGWTQAHERTLAEATEALLVCYDDTLNAHHCDLIFNANIYATAQAYQDKVPAHTQFLCGPEFAQLRDEYQQLRSHNTRSITTNTAPTKLLITLGGSDPDNVSADVLRALEQLNPSNLQITLVAGPANKHIENLRELIDQSGLTIDLVIAPDNLALLFFNADFAITAAGQTTLEAIALETPSLCVQIADNQSRILKFLADNTLSLCVTLADAHCVQTLKHGISQLLLPQTREQLAIRLAQFAPAIGQSSAAKAMTCAIFTHFALRPAIKSDKDALFNLANDPEVRAVSLSTKNIDYATHCTWFEQQIANPNSVIYIVHNPKNFFMGSVRFALQPKQATIISISIVKDARGCGLATTLLQQAVERFYADTQSNAAINAVVKTSNPASFGAFKKAGFVLHQKNAEQYLFSYPSPY